MKYKVAKCEGTHTKIMVEMVVVVGEKVDEELNERVED